MGKPLLTKKNRTACLTFAKKNPSLWFPKPLGKYSVDRSWNPVTCGIKLTLKTSSYNGQAWWWWCDSWGLLWCFRSWIICCNWWKREICSQPENPEGEWPTISICPDPKYTSSFPLKLHFANHPIYIYIYIDRYIWSMLISIKPFIFRCLSNHSGC